MFYKHAWVLGATGGIGSVLSNICFELAQNVSLADIKDPSWGLLKIDQNKLFLKTDLSSRPEMIKFAIDSVKKFRSPDFMLIASGRVFSMPLSDTSDEEIESTYKNNFKLVALALQAFFEYCDHSSDVKKNIIIISSNASSEARPNQPIYAAMKAAINRIAQSQAVAWGHYGIKINCIAPGTVAVPRNIEFLRKKFIDFPLDQNRPLGKIIFPENLIEVFKFLADPDLLMTGQVITIDGGSNLV